MLEIQTIQFINSLKWNEFKILKGHIYVKEEEIELICKQGIPQALQQ